MEELTMEESEGIIHKQKEAVCMTRSDSMSIGSIGSDAASVGGGSEEMDTEDSEKDPKESFLRSKRGRSSASQERPPKQSLDNMSLPLDNQRDASYDLERIAGDVTSPVIENKLSDDVSGYYAMRTSLLSQSAVILENGGAVGKTSSGRYQDNNCNVGAKDSGIMSSCEVRKSSKLFHTGYTSGSDSESEAEGCSMQSVNEKHENKISNSEQEANILSAADLKVKTEPESDGEELVVDQHAESESKDITSLMSVKAECQSKGRLDTDGNDEPLRKVSVDILEGNASDSMAEIEKSGLEAKLARVSKRRVYSRVRDLGQSDDSSSESDSESDSEDEEEEEKEMIFEDLQSAKVLFNAAQPDSEKLIERDALKMACMDDLLSDCESSEDSSESSSEESSDSDDSSDSDVSSADDSDDEADEEPKNYKGRQHSTVSKEGLNEGLPEVEYLQISLPPSVQLTKVGYVSSIIGSLVIIQADQGSPALNMESVLFKPDRAVLGQVFELFGPVVSPFYSVRFNNAADIDKHEIKLKMEVFFAPQNVDVTQYVFTEQLKKMRGSDASWKNDEECPAENAEFSDDEAESMAKNKKKREKKRKVAQGRIEGTQQGQTRGRHGNRQQDQFQGRRNQPRAHPPLQRQPACRPPQFGPPHHHHYQAMPRPTNQPGWMHNMGPPRGDIPFPPRQWYGAPTRPSGFPPGVPPMFQNLQATEPPSGHQPPQMMQQQGYSARKIDGSVPMNPDASMFSPQMFSPWQKRPPQPPASWDGVSQPGRTPENGSSNPQDSSILGNPFSNHTVPPVPGFSCFSVPPPSLTRSPPPPPGVPPPRGAADHAHKPPSLMEQPVLPPASLLQASPGQSQWNQTQFAPKFGSSVGTPVSTSNFAPPPIPPPSFHPRMMQSFRRDTKTQNNQGASQHWYQQS